MPQLSHRSNFAWTLAIVGLLAAAGRAAPPTDERLSAAETAFEKAQEKQRSTGAERDPAVIRAAAAEALSGIEIGEMSAAQLDQHIVLILEADREPEVRTRLAELAKDPTPTGAAAAILAFQLVRSSEGIPARVEAVRAALLHPAIEQMVREGNASELFFQIRGRGPLLTRVGDDALRIGGWIDEDVAPKGVPALGSYYQSIMGLRDTRPAEVERIRRAILSAIDRVAPNADAALASLLAKTRRLLEGNFARGELVGHPTPPMSILWSSDPTITSMESLRGKVVVLDFWSTFCGPCIGSFPSVRELAERYRGYPVVVLGVTGVQGQNPAPGGPIDTKGHPEREFELMPEFMKAKNMTWPVVYVAEGEFHPDFGVFGIPHGAIIDSAGVVRWSDEPIHGDLSPLYTKIDDLLREAGLPFPPAKAAEPALREADAAPSK